MLRFHCIYPAIYSPKMSAVKSCLSTRFYHSGKSCFVHHVGQFKYLVCLWMREILIVCLVWHPHQCPLYCSGELNWKTKLAIYLTLYILIQFCVHQVLRSHHKVSSSGIQNKASCQDATWMCTLEGASDLSNLTDTLKYTWKKKKDCPNFPPRPKMQSAQEEILSVTLLKVSQTSLTYVYPNLYFPIIYGKFAKICEDILKIRI